MKCMLASRCTAKHINKFLKTLVYQACAQANERRNCQTAESCGDKQCMGVRVLDISLSSSLLRSIFPLLFVHSIAMIKSRVCYCSFFFLFYSSSAHPSSYIIALTLHSLFPFLSFHTFLVHSDRVHMHSRYQLIYFIKH